MYIYRKQSDDKDSMSEGKEIGVISFLCYIGCSVLCHLNYPFNRRLSVENISCCLGIYRYTSETKKVFSWLISLLVTLFKHRTSSSVMCLLCTQKEFIYTVSTSRREFKLRLRSLKYVGFFSLDLVLS